VPQIVPVLPVDRPADTRRALRVLGHLERLEGQDRPEWALLERLPDDQLAEALRIARVALALL